MYWFAAISLHVRSVALVDILTITNVSRFSSITFFLRSESKVRIASARYLRSKVESDVELPLRTLLSVRHGG